MKHAPRFLALTFLALASFGCSGAISEKPPLHLVLDMDDQQKIQAQEEFEFGPWADKRGMRLPVAGTVPQGALEHARLATFKDASGNFVSNPLDRTLENFERGRERFNIYCAVCHDRAGSGYGMVLQRAPTGSFANEVPDLAREPRLRDMSDGELCQTITMGKGTMPAYGHMIRPSDRWAIVHYLRALQNRIEE